jgi:hypothetical protein
MDPSKSSDARNVYVIDGEILEEVPDTGESYDIVESDEEQGGFEGDDSERMEVFGEGLEDILEGDEIMEEDNETISDMAYFVFTGHSSNGYCVAVHPTIPGLIATGIFIICLL